MRDSKTFLSAVALVAALVVSALPAAAQTGRIGGQVKDAQSGQPLKGATITAENPAASPSSFTATTDDKGRYSIIGLKTGTWKVTASAPGFQPSSGQVPVRSLGAPMPPVDFALAAGAAGPAGALAGVNTKELQGELQKAIDMANAGQHDAAIAAYEAILVKTPALTMINGQIAQVKRLKKDYDGAIAVVSEGHRRRSEQRQGEDRNRHDLPREGRLRERREVAARSGDARSTRAAKCSTTSAR